MRYYIKGVETPTKSQMVLGTSDSNLIILTGAVTDAGTNRIPVNEIQLIDSFRFTG